MSVRENPLEIIVGYNVNANYKANSERHILPFKIIPSKIYEWTYDKAMTSVGDKNYIESIEVIEVENGICLEFSTPVTIRLVTDSLVIEELELIKTTFKPWTSETEIYLTSDFSEIPRPEFWKENLSKYGHNILFRYYAGDERQPEQVPYPDYQGYYIQLADRIKSTQEGIFINYLKLKNAKLSLSFENKDEDLKDVWNDLTSILADFPNAKIYSGNCEFTGIEWKKYLTDKILPTTE
ncbi:MAG: metallophosphoesterase [Ignavibacteriales bacterium]|nr:MAG: metallophosphoesterase [Ignavibacteriales bacterium]